MVTCYSSPRKLILLEIYWLTHGVEGRADEACLEVCKDRAPLRFSATSLWTYCPQAICSTGLITLYTLLKMSKSQERDPDSAYPVPFPAALLEHKEWRTGDFPKEMIDKNNR